MYSWKSSGFAPLHQPTPREEYMPKYWHQVLRSKRSTLQMETCRQQTVHSRLYCLLARSQKNKIYKQKQWPGDGNTPGVQSRDNIPGYLKDLPQTWGDNVPWANISSKYRPSWVRPTEALPRRTLLCVSIHLLPQGVGSRDWYSALWSPCEDDSLCD